MNHTFTFNIKTYKELKYFFNSFEYKYCEICKEFTYHLKCGFEKSNYRVECLKCN